MKTPIRYQSQLLVRRSYKPGRIARRKLGITFHPTRPVVVLISKNRNDNTPEKTSPDELTFSG